MGALRRGVVAAAVLAVSVCGAARAEKGFPIGTYVVRYLVKSSITVVQAPGGVTAYGTVKSIKHGCVANRSVGLNYFVGDGPNQFLAEGRTDVGGNWMIPFQIPGGLQPDSNFFLVVPSKRLWQTPRHAYNCGSWVTPAVFAQG